MHFLLCIILYGWFSGEQLALRLSADALIKYELFTMSYQNDSISNIVNSLLADFDARRDLGNRHHNALRMWAWRFTVRFSYFIKRLFDLVASIAALAILGPLVFIPVAIAIKLDSPGPVFYVETRVGKYGHHFRFFKFRSMHVGADKLLADLKNQNESADGVTFKMKKDPRVTRVGRFIRKFSIDELPQLLNILFNDMSFVGPRPAKPNEVSIYNPDDRKRMNVKPGLTGVWQVSGRSDLPFKKQVYLDKEYIQSWSIKQDIIILLKTIPAVFTGKGAY